MGCRRSQRRQVFYSVYRNFNGAEAVTVQIMDADAQKILSFVGHTDILVERERSLKEVRKVRSRQICVDGTSTPVDQRAVPIVNSDQKFNRIVVHPIR